jgi:hypothetical protein
VGLPRFYSIPTMQRVMEKHRCVVRCSTCFPLHHPCNGPQPPLPRLAHIPPPFPPTRPALRPPRLADAHATGLPAGCADLVTVAQALHWFDAPAFYREARRVLSAPRGALAVWCYGLATVEAEGHPADAALKDIFGEELGPYWDERRKLVDNMYRGERRAGGPRRHLRSDEVLRVMDEGRTPCATQRARPGALRAATCRRRHGGLEVCGHLSACLLATCVLKAHPLPSACILSRHGACAGQGF